MVKEALGEPYAPEVERGDRDEPAVLRDQLSGTTADIDDHDPASDRLETRGGAGVGQAALLTPGEQLGLSADDIRSGVEELLAVHRVPYGRRGHHPHPSDFQPTHGLTELPQHCQRALDGVHIQLAEWRPPPDRDASPA